MRTIGCLLVLAGSLAAQTITGIVNPASDLPPGVPNYGIAQGSVFIVYGSSLAALALVQATLPLPTTLGGVTITVAGGTVAPIPVPILYVSGGQIAAVMPSTTPVGNDTVSVNYNGKTATANVKVTATTFGLSTGPGGYGPAAAFFPNSTEQVTTTDTAAPGDTLTVYGTGLGALAAPADDTKGAPVGDMTGIVSLKVLVGGVPATVIYAGRSPGSVGLDQINFVVPATAPLGCQISVIVQTSSPTVTVSNAPTIALASVHHTQCTDATQTVPLSVLNGLLTKSSVRAIGIDVSQNTPYSITGTGGGTPGATTGSFTAFFLGFTPAQLKSTVSNLNGTSSLNSCFTEVIQGSIPDSSPNASGLDAGASITVLNTTGKSNTVTAGGTGLYSAQAGSFAAGSYTVTTTGGADVGATTFTFTVPQAVTWTNINSGLTAGSIDRTKDLTITWTGGDAFGYVEILGTAQLGPQNSPTYTLAFDCAAPTSAQSFTIPSAVLQMMPTGTNAYASITLSTNSYSSAIASIPGFDFAVNNSKNSIGIPVVYK